MFPFAHERMLIDRSISRIGLVVAFYLLYTLVLAVYA